jgi:hypothetical protein
MEKLEICVCYGIKCAKIHHFCEIRKWRKNQTLVTDPKQLAFLIPDMFGAVLYFCGIFS